MFEQTKRGDQNLFFAMTCGTPAVCWDYGAGHPVQGHSGTSMALLQLNLLPKIAAVRIKEDPCVSCCLEPLEKWQDRNAHTIVLECRIRNNGLKPQVTC